MEQCCLFSYPTAEEAAKNMQFEVVEDYGFAFYNPDGSVKHYLYTWDDGHRELLRCKRCGALFLRQSSEYHDMSGGDDCYYTDYYPVSNHEEALAYNEKYNGFTLERSFEGLIIKQDNKSTGITWHWNKPDKDY